MLRRATELQDGVEYTDGRYELGSGLMLEASASGIMSSWSSPALFIISDRGVFPGVELARVDDRCVMSGRVQHPNGGNFKFLMRDPSTCTYFRPHVPLIFDDFYLFLLPDGANARDYECRPNAIGASDIRRMRAKMEELKIFRDCTLLNETRPRSSARRVVDAHAQPFVQRTAEITKTETYEVVALRARLSDDGDRVIDIERRPRRELNRDEQSAQLTEAQVLRAENAIIQFCDQRDRIVDTDVFW